MALLAFGYRKHQYADGAWYQILRWVDGRGPTVVDTRKRLQDAKVLVGMLTRNAHPRDNPAARPRVLWFLVTGKHWITATAKNKETVQEALRRSYLAHTGYSNTNLLVTKPTGTTMSEWENAIRHWAVYKPQHTGSAKRNPRWEDLHGPDHEALMQHLNKAASRQLWEEVILPPKRKKPRKPSKRNPPRDPKYVGAFKLWEEPKKTGPYVDGDTAAVQGLHATGKHLERDYEVWVFGMIDPVLGNNWNYVSGPMERSAAIEEAKRLAAF